VFVSLVGCCGCVCVCVYYFACVWLGVGLAGGSLPSILRETLRFWFTKCLIYFVCGRFHEKVVAKSLDYESLR
jgi:hypothetical protein